MAVKDEPEDVLSKLLPESPLSSPGENPFQEKDHGRNN